MYLSHIAFDIQNSWTRQSLKDCHDMHRTIMQAFPDTNTSPRSRHHVLYRLHLKSESPTAFVQSEVEPSWDALSQKGVTLLQSRNTNRVISCLIENKQLGFHLLACPTKKVSRENKLSARIYLNKPEDRMEWMKRKSEENGFELINCWEQEEITVYGSHRKSDGGEMYLRGANFAGNLLIHDKDKFIKAYKEGIGAEKAYGFGLLLITSAKKGMILYQKTYMSFPS